MAEMGLVHNGGKAFNLQFANDKLIQENLRPFV